MVVNRRARPLPPEPTEASLHEAALRHLARYGTTAADLTRVLGRRIARWARAVDAAAEADAAARIAARSVVARLVAAGAVDDAAFAAARTRRLLRSGRSSRVVAAHLAARGIDPKTTRAVLPEDPERDLRVAVAAVRRRRIGPFRPAPADPDGVKRELAALARAGFAEAVARRVLAMEAEEAEAILARLRYD